MNKPKPKRPKHVDVTLSADAHEKLTEMGEPASLRSYCAYILELHADGSNGLRELTHPVKQKGKR